MEKEVRLYSFSAETENGKLFNSIVENTAKVAAASAYKHWGSMGLIEEVTVDDYKSAEKDVRAQTIAFSAKTAGIETPKTVNDFAFAMDNSVFRSVMNSISSRVIATMMVNYRSPQLERLAFIDRVDVGGSKTIEIRSKALPVAQMGTYGHNVTGVFQESVSSVVNKPQPYTIGKSLNYIRMFSKAYDWGYEIAKVYAGLQFAKYKLVVNVLFATTALTGTPFYNANFTNAGYTQLASDIGMIAGTAPVAYGTLPAWNAISGLATQGGFTTKDEYIRNAFLQKILGVDSMVLSQFTDASAPFTTAGISALRAIPDNMIVLVAGGEAPVSLVEEDYVRVHETDANDNTLNRMEYIITQSFNAVLATGSPIGLQGTTVGG